MRFDSSRFFREATLRICGNLEIEKAMSSFLEYIQEYIPADRLLLEYFDRDARVMRTIVDATREKSENIDMITPLSQEARAFLKKKYQDGIPEPYYYDKPNEISLTRELLAFYNQEAESILVLPLGTQSVLVGVVTFISTHLQYNEKHLELVSLLKEPFQIAMSNALKHRNELRLFDRDFFWEITKRLCGNLEIEEGLRSCVEYMAKHLPVDVMYLQKYESELNAMRIVARARENMSEQMDLLVPFNSDSTNALLELANVWRAGELPAVIRINKPLEEPVTIHMQRSLGEPPSSALSMPLILENKIIGTLVVLAEGNDRYSEYHSNLYSLLKEPFFVAMSNTLKHREVLKLKDLLADDNRYLHGELRRISGDEIIGANFGLKEVMEKAGHVASLDSPVLLLGETGAGKDVIANAIHYSSPRKNGPFVSVNCGAIPDTLIDSELFGHEKGAFTGALAQKRGRFERADKGTIFLDEIGELPLPAQVRLLKVIQSKEIERVGGVKTIPLDIRIIAATNRDLEKMVQSGEFREDLWFRLNVFPISIPPLRERKHDIAALLQHLIILKTRELKLPQIPAVVPDSMKILMNYGWPGNVRELGNLVERSMILNPAGPLDFSLLIPSGKVPDEIPLPGASSSRNLDNLISDHIQNVVLETNGKIHGPGGAAEILGVNPSSLRNKMNKYGIKYGRSFKEKI